MQSLSKTCVFLKRLLPSEGHFNILHIKMETFATIVNNYELLTIAARLSLLDVCEGLCYASCVLVSIGLRFLLRHKSKFALEKSWVKNFEILLIECFNLLKINFMLDFIRKGGKRHYKTIKWVSFNALLSRTSAITNSDSLSDLQSRASGITK